MNVNITKTADMFADAGFICICPDMYKGKVGKNREEAGHLMGGLDWEGSVKDICAAIDFLKSKGCEKVGITGFCMGGALTLAAGSYCNNVDAIAPYYGIPNLEIFKLENINCPILSQYGELDDKKGFSDPESGIKVHEKLISLGKNSQIKIWEKADHAFMNVDS